MQKRKIIITLGILITLMPFLGFPGAVEDVFFVVAGLGVALAVYYSGTAGENHKAYNNETKVIHNVESDEIKEIHSDNV